MEKITLMVNEQDYEVEVDLKTPLIFVLRNDLGFKSPKLGCAKEQCGACKVLVDDVAVPSCELPVERVKGLKITTLEGLGTPEELHPLQEAFLEEQAAQCGYCTSGMIMTAQGLLNRVRYPTDEDIHEAFAANLCRCGIYDRVRHAIQLRVGRRSFEALNYELLEQAPMGHASNKAPVSLDRFPEIDSWVCINEDETVTIFSGKVEIGQGIKTALIQIAADELDVSPSRITIVTADTDITPDEGLTAGSMSIEVSGASLRVASAEARLIMLKMAFEELEAETPVTELVVEDGIVTDPATGRKTSYWELMGGQRFDQPVSGVAKPKHPNQYKYVGQPEKRVDLLSKVTGGISYVHDMELPDMLHARVLHPPNYHARLASADFEAVKNMAGVVEVVQDGSFLAVITEREEQAIWAVDALRESATWGQIKPMPSQAELIANLQNDTTESALVIEGAATDEPIPAIEAPENAKQTIEMTYFRPYQMHASLGPSAAMAQWDGNKLTVWSHTQGAFILQGALADLFGIDSKNVRVIHAEGSGAYGHNAAEDAALDAVLAARAVNGRPVLLKWTRHDEHGWEPYSSAMLMKMNASLDDTGTVVDWNQDTWSYAHSTRPRAGQGDKAGFVSAWHLEKPFDAPLSVFRRGAEFGGQRNLWPAYAFEHLRIVRHFAPNSPLRVSAMRGLGAYGNVFAIESFMDELAFAAGIDPVEFRLKHLTNERAIAVIKAAAEKSNWEARTHPNGNGKGRGFAYAQYKNRQTYTAIVVDVTVDTETGEIKLDKVLIAADTGQIVNPDGTSNQFEGGFMQAASWTLYEEVNYDDDGITSLDWETYPILHFENAPSVEVALLNRPDQPTLGAGEATPGPTPAAIANAVYDAVGVRIRDLPLTPEKVLKVLKNQA